MSFWSNRRLCVTQMTMICYMCITTILKDRNKKKRNIKKILNCFKNKDNKYIKVNILKINGKRKYK